MDVSMDDLKQIDGDTNVKVQNISQSIKTCTEKHSRLLLFITLILLVLSIMFLALYIDKNKGNDGEMRKSLSSTDAISAMMREKERLEKEIQNLTQKNAEFKKERLDLNKKIKVLNEELKDAMNELLEKEILASMDTTADPCEDFYQYACGGWMNKSKIPKGKKMYNTMAKLTKENRIIVKRILEKLERNYKDLTPLLQQTFTFYNSCMEIQPIDYVLSEVKELIKKLGSWPVTDPNFNESTWNFKNSLVEIHKLLYGGMLFEVRVAQNLRNTSQNIITFGRDGSLKGLMYNDIMTANFAEEEKIKAIIKYLGQANGTEMYVNAAIDLMNRLDEISLAQKQTDLDESYELTTMDQLANDIKIPVEWLLNFVQMLFNETGIPITKSEPVAVFKKDYIRQTYKEFSAENKSVQATYLIGTALAKIDGYLPPNYEKTINNRTITIVKERGEVCLATTMQNFELVLTKPFVEEVYDETTLDFTKEMAVRIKKIFSEQIHTMTWIDNTTRELAERKMRMMKDEVGFPSYINNNTEMMLLFGGMNIQDGEYFLNCLEILKLKARKNTERLGKSYDRTIWKIGPITVNAINDRLNNKIVIPAGISQIPYYRKYAPRAVNYGGIGMIVGHELIHGFDNTGILFDHEGDLESWWSSSSLKEFNKRAQCFAKQYSNYTIQGNKVNGNRTLSENIADNGGFRQTVLAYEKWLKNNVGRLDDETLKGVNVTARQLLFLSLGQIWCSLYTADGAIISTYYNHSPNKFRVNGPLKNMQEFSDTFKCPKGSKMNPTKKCHLW